MRLLVVGAGGREHALAWKLACSPRVSEILVAPGNAGTDLEPRVRNVPMAADDVDGLLRLAREQAVDLTVIGPEAPLVAGIVDRFEAAGMRCFGPRAAAARLEGSKAFSKEFMARHRIPTAGHRLFTSAEPALDFVRKHGAPVVIKADGLAAGKGVVVAQSVGEAEAAVRSMLCEDAFGEAGRRVVVEDFLVGEEASFIAIVDGEHILPLASSQDHKACNDGDRGPNTGGMGAYSPAPVVTGPVAERTLAEVMRPVVEGMRLEGCPYVGFLYAGLMIAPDGTPRVLEFNCRFGDPETQPILFRMESDLLGLLEAALEQRLHEESVRWDPRHALGVVMAAPGYPGSYRKGDAISGLPDSLPEHLKVFHAGTRAAGNEIVTDGGRVLCCVAKADRLSLARDEAYALVERISWPGAHYRRDIGYRGIARERGR